MAITKMASLLKYGLNQTVVKPLHDQSTKCNIVTSNYTMCTYVDTPFLNKKVIISA